MAKRARAVTTVAPGSAAVPPPAAAAMARQASYSAGAPGGPAISWPFACDATRDDDVAPRAKNRVRGSRQPRRRRRRITAAVPRTADPTAAPPGPSAATVAAVADDDRGPEPNSASFVRGDEGSGYIAPEAWWWPFHEQGAREPYYVGVTNVVTTAHLRTVSPTDQTRVAMQTLAMVCCGRFDQTLFPAVSIPISMPRGTLSLFASGRIVLTGFRTAAQTILAASMVLDHLRHNIGIVGDISDEVTENVVGAASLGARLDLERLELDYPTIAVWDRSTFAGLCFSLPRRHHTQQSVNVFKTGCFIIVGALSRERIVEIHHETYYRLLPYVVDTALLTARWVPQLERAREIVRATGVLPLYFDVPGRCPYGRAIRSARLNTASG